MLSSAGQDTKRHHDALQQKSQHPQGHQDLPCINPISESSVRRIVAGQAVTDLSSAVKELLDNALDASARTINVRLFGQDGGPGKDLIEVSDDGCGVPPSSRPYLAMKHATSKLASFDDLYSVSNSSSNGKQLGFRGEALFCLANISQSLVIATRTATESFGQKLVFLHDGTMDVRQTQDVARKVGTTVAICKLFDALPVRRTDFVKRLKAQRAKMLKLLQGYAIFAVGVAISLTDITGRVGTNAVKSEMRLVTSASSKSLEETISSVLGPKFLMGLSRLTPIDLSHLVVATESNGQESDINTWKIEGLVSCAPSQSSKGVAKELQFFSVNNRPVDLPRLSRALSDAWRNFDSGSGKRPACVLALTLPNNMFDINLSPDKREVLLTEESTICDLLCDAVMKLWSSQSHGVFSQNEVQNMSCGLNGSAASFSPKKTTPSVNGTPAANAALHQQLSSTLTLSQPVEVRPRQQSLKRYTNSPRHSSNTASNPAPVEEGISSLPVPSSPHSTNSKMRRRYAFVHDPTVAERRQKQNLNFSVEGYQDAPMPLGSIRQTRRGSGVPADAVRGRRECDLVKELNARAQEREMNKVQTEENNSNTHPPSQATERISEPTMAERQQWNHASQEFARGEHKAESPQEADIKKLNDLLLSEKTSRVKNGDSTENPGKRNGSHKRKPQEQRTKNHKKRTKHTLTLKEQVKKLGAFALGANVQNSNDSDQSVEDNDDSSGNSSETDDSCKDFVPSRKGPIPSSVDKCNLRLSFDNVNDDDMISAPEGDIAKTKQQLKPSCVEEVKAGHVAASPPNEQSPKENGVSKTNIVWDSFCGTEDAVGQYQQARLQMRSNRKLLQRANASRKNRSTADLASNGAAVPESVGLEDNTQYASTPKSVSLTKDDFLHMEVIGQFNLGFILAKCKNQNLWILDQHASDEKYNFERLCANTIIHEQQLIVPLPLELSPSEENCVLENMDIFQKNGFRFLHDPGKPPRHRLSLTAVPHSGSGGGGSKAVQFGKDDVGALCAMLGADGGSSSMGYGSGCGTGADGSGSSGNNAVRRYAGGIGSQTSTNGGTGENGKTTSLPTITRLPKAVAMFASRACRSSIMIGTALSKREMDAVVKKMHGVVDPWSCPHGRPTIRHVTDIISALIEDEKTAAQHIAGPSLAVLSQVDCEEGSV